MLVPVDIRNEGFSVLADRLFKEDVTIYRSVPTVFRHFADTISEDQLFPTLRLVYLVGEPVNKAHVERYKKVFSHECLLLNVLGSTEALTFRTYFMDMETEMRGLEVPAGYAVEGKEVVLVNEDMRETIFGEIGEIAVRSRYLAQGYWRNPVATQEKFLPDPNGGLESLYLTGDLGRIEFDGCLIHLGRKDFQVKIRGYRVELGEIEMTLMNHVGVKEAAIISNEDRNGESQMTAYFVPKNELVPTPNELRSFLKDKLPEYMIPSSFISVASFPLTETGKVDRRMLPNARRVITERHTSGASQMTVIEKQLVEIWKQVLTIDTIHIHDNFFDLGGHSLAAMRLVSRVIKQFQLEIPLQSLFQSPTIADMAAVIADHQGKALDEQGLAVMLEELESLSDEDAKQLLGKQHPDISKA